MLVLDQMKFKFSINVLSETYLLPNEVHIFIERRTAFSVSSDRKRFHRGDGLFDFVLDKVTSIKNCNMSRFFSSYESTEIEISLGRAYLFYLCGVCIPSSCKVHDFNHDFFEMIRTSTGGKECIIISSFKAFLLGLNSVVAHQDLLITLLLIIIIH